MKDSNEEMRLRECSQSMSNRPDGNFTNSNNNAMEEDRKLCVKKCLAQPTALTAAHRTNERTEKKKFQILHKIETETETKQQQHSPRARSRRKHRKNEME